MEDWRVSKKEQTLDPPEPPPINCPVRRMELGWQDKIVAISRTDHIVGCTCCLDICDAEDWFIDTYEDYQGAETVWEDSN